MKNRITELLDIEYPIISAAMTWVTSAEFVAAVSNAGGMGVLGPNAGQTEKSSSPEDTAERLRKEIQKVKQLTEKNRLKEHHINIIYRDLSPTVQKLVEAGKSGVDALIATGYEAGGHMSDYKISTLSLVPQVTSLVNIPVIAAGGIIDGKGAKAAFAMGAEGVYMGTRFIATKENPARDATKQAILNVNSEEFIEFKSGIGHLRTIPTEAGKKAFELINQGKPDEAYKYYGNGFKIGMLDGDLVNGTISLSEAAGGIKEIKTCAEVINEIMSTLEK
ncbi:nitronate monooxygenase family protein [Bacillus sp. V2I10]|uniref:NAD(P)H-dependent flavin oxidoreductase n=1 Tax=Bacillus sp. V2I10 TaxID=3042276 RepID=UPI002785D682|nr:nitronate monooxygenase [Bacillus sp. V2I10]MDQ0856564.1 enoyl-[acyl-carrier protein] reductase II [Bacillus sp. V2I10]